MADKENSAVSPSKAEVPQNRGPQSGVLHGVKRWLLPLVLLVHASMLGYSAFVHSPMTDEIAHFAAGLGHWRYSDFELYNVNPPLARVVGTFPVYVALPWRSEVLDNCYVCAGSRIGENGIPESNRKEFQIGDRLMAEIGQSYRFWMVIARWTCIWFSCLGAWICYSWAKELYGNGAGIIAIVLWCTSPLVLAFGGALTPDVPSGAMGLLALYRFWKWAKDPNWGNTYFAGIAVGLAELTKSTWILLHPMLFLFGIGLIVVRSNRLSLGMQCFAQLFLAWIVLLAGYGFTDQFKPLGEFDFNTPRLQIREFSNTGEIVKLVSNRFRNTWMESIPVPLPTEMVRGVDAQESAMAAQTIVGFLCGELRLGGWWYYYLVVLAVKCTIGELGLFVIATMGRLIWTPKSKERFLAFRFAQSSVCAFSKASASKIVMRWFQIDTIVLLVPVVVYLCLLSYHTGLNRHARYMLQFLPLCFVWASQSVRFFPRRPWLRFGVIALAGFGSLSSLFYFPHSLSYFNELVGGPSQGHKYLSGTNIDWGHDVYYLRNELKRRGWDSVGISLWTRYDLKLAGIETQIRKVPKFRPSKEGAVDHIVDESNVLQPGRYAISVCVVQGTMRLSGQIKSGEPIENGYSYFQEFKPVGRVGYSIWLYEISEEDILRSQSWGKLYRTFEHDAAVRETSG
jgi:hypothetical protein